MPPNTVMFSDIRLTSFSPIETQSINNFKAKPKRDDRRTEADFLEMGQEFRDGVAGDTKRRRGEKLTRHAAWT